MATHARPGKSFTDMLQLILDNMRRPNNPFSPQLLMAIFWEESFFNNRKQERGSAIGFGQAEPAELPKLTTQQARDNGYEVPGVSRNTRELTDALAVTVPSCMLLHLFHSSRAATTEDKVRAALHGYGGVDFRGPSALTREDRLRIIGNWRKCEEKLKALPFSVYAIANYSGNVADLAERYMDALALAKPFQRDFQFTTPPAVKVRDILFPPGWSLLGWPAARAGAPAAAPPSAPAAGAGGAARAESLFEEIVSERSVSLDGGRRMVLVAGPGEELPPLEEGDLLVRRSRAGGRPRASRIQSAPAMAEEFVFEGVAPENGPRGYYVRVAGSRAPIARHIADVRGRVAAGTLVVRPQWFEDAEDMEGAGAEDAGEDFTEDTDAQLTQRRTTLVAGITGADLYWHDVPLRDGFKIKVSSPVFKDGVFVPVTAAETMALARRLQVFPLSRAVMDQAHNFANQVPKPASPDSLYDYVTYTQRLRATPYVTQYGYALSSGAHKLWVVSARGPVINYGFYIPRARGELVRCGPNLDPKQNVIQGLGAAHNAQHWDYSQLLQFMSNLRDASGQAVDLRQALLDKNPAVWDEAAPPAAASLP